MPAMLPLLDSFPHFTAYHSPDPRRVQHFVYATLKYSPKSIFASLCSSNAVVCLLTRLAGNQNECGGSLQMKSFSFNLGKLTLLFYTSRFNLSSAVKTQHNP